MNTERKARIGSVSSGTLRQSDLLNAFATELEWLQPSLNVEKISRARHIAEELETIDAPNEAELEESAADLIYVLFEKLNALAPPYCYFGANEGDGSEFGFWPNQDALDELPRYSDWSEVPEGGPGDDYAIVNDHGNFSVYGADGTLIWDIV